MPTDLHEAPDQVPFQSRQDRPNRLLPLVELENLPLDCLTQLSQIGLAHRVPNGHENFAPGFHKHAFVERESDFFLGLRFVKKDGGRQRGDAVQAMRQDAKETLRRVRDDPQDVIHVDEDLEWQHNL